MISLTYIPNDKYVMLSFLCKAVNQERHEIQIRGLKEEIKMQGKLIMDIRRQIEKLQSK